MNVSELLLPDGRPSGVWMCGKCHNIRGHNGAPPLLPAPSMPWKDDAKVLASHSEWARDRAEACCRPAVCKRCGGLTEKQYYAICSACDLIQSREKEAERFEKANKLTVEQWGKSDAAEMLYDNRYDKWFNDFDDAGEWYADDEERERPAYLWCTVPVEWRPDASGYVADQLHDNFHEDAYDQITDAEYKRLDEFVNAWWAQNKVTSYDPDFSRCVLLPPVEQKGAA